MYSLVGRIGRCALCRCLGGCRSSGGGGCLGSGGCYGGGFSAGCGHKIFGVTEVESCLEGLNDAESENNNGEEDCEDHSDFVELLIAVATLALAVVGFGRGAGDCSRHTLTLALLKKNGNSENSCSGNDEYEHNDFNNIQETGAYF